VVLTNVEAVQAYLVGKLALLNNVSDRLGCGFWNTVVVMSYVAKGVEAKFDGF
jgi:erythromycin esterase-like protein